MRRRWRRAGAVVVAAAVMLVAMDTAAAAAVMVGPDVSGWQHVNGSAVDWTKVRASGSTFAIVKATEGDYYTNPFFRQDQRGARAAKLLVGAYAFARPALPVSTADAQARYFAAAVGNVRSTGTLPPILDLEVSGGLAPSDLVTWTQRFLETLRTATGRTPIVYSYPSFWANAMAASSAFSRYPLWEASYSATTPRPFPGWTAWTLWQYTSTAAVGGIAGPSDMSRFNGTPAQLAALTNGVPATSWPVTAPFAPHAVAAVAGNRQAVVRWQPSDDGGQQPSQYTVTVTPGARQVTVPGTQTSVAIASLVAGSGYTFHVTATNTAGDSAASTESPSVTPGQTPTAPGLPTVVLAPGAVQLSWPPSLGSPTRYDVHRCDPAPCVPAKAVLFTVPTPRGADRTALTGTRYQYAVTAVNAFGTSPSSPAATASPVGPPSVPERLTASAGTSTLTLSWLPPARDGGAAVTGYVVTADGVVTEQPPTARSFTATGLTPGTTHDVSVAANSALGTGPAAALQAATSTPAVAHPAPAPAVVRILPIATVVSGQSLPVRISVTRAGTSAGLPGVTVVLGLRPQAGPPPKPVRIVTDGQGLAEAVLRPELNGVLTATALSSTTTTTATTVAAVTVRPVITTVLSAATVAAGKPVALSGATSSSFAGERVYRQGYFSGAWHNWATTIIASNGTYRFTIVPTTITVDTYRVVLPASHLHGLGISPTRDLHIT